MSRKRTRKPKLPKLIEQSPDVVAVVDADFEVVYANDACCQWLGVSLEQLQSSPLKFGICGNQAEDIANGICPDPRCFEPDFASNIGYVASHKDEQPVWRKATFTSLRDSDEGVSFVLIITHGADQRTLTDECELPLSAELNAIVHDIQSEQASRYTLDVLLGKSEFSKQLKKKLEAIAANRSDCLIFGPVGSGREHFARTIFAMRNLPNENLVPVYCAIADDEIIQESIKEWAFGQQQNRSNDWLLLLDVDKMQPNAQLELFGYTQLPNFPLRILATSESDLVALAKADQFHFGLAMQLSIQVVELPALCNRKTDLPLIWQFFIETKNQSSKKQIAGVSPEVEELFYEYHWPRNIDELKECIEIAHEHCDGSVIKQEHLPPSFRHGLTAARIGAPNVDRIVLDEFLGSIEKELIERALRQTKNNKTKAADLLGISRAKLLRRAAAMQLVQNSSTSPSEQIDSSVFIEAED